MKKICFERQGVHRARICIVYLINYSVLWIACSVVNLSVGPGYQDQGTTIDEQRQVTHGDQI